ncbi:MAG: T9SS type A sorting domain-containing protein [Saprospiraceae bacterium]|nr:T9SS type A sorting domain-containing protein [Saprospiraceae bacterium]
MRSKMYISTVFISFCSIVCFSQRYFYVSDAGNFQQGPYQILRYNSDGSGGKVFIKDNLAWPQDILFLENQKVVLVSNLSTNSIEKYDANTGEYMSNFAGNVQGATRMKIGKDGLLYVLQWNGDNKVMRFDLNGNFIDNFTQTGVVTSIGLDWDKNGILYISSYNGKFVERFDKQGKSLGKFISTGLAGPTNIHFLDNGHLLVLDYNSGIIKRYDESGNFIQNIVTGVLQCEGINFLTDGSFAIGVGSTSSVNQYDEAGNFIKQLVPNKSNNLLNPNAVIWRDISSKVDDEQKVEKFNFLHVESGKTISLIRHEQTSMIDTVNIFDMNSKLVLSQDLKINPTINAINWPKGIYFAKASLLNHRTITQEIVIY